MSYGPHQRAFAWENQYIALHILSAEKIVEICVELRGGILSLKAGLFIKYITIHSLGYVAGRKNDLVGWKSKAEQNMSPD